MQHGLGSVLSLTISFPHAWRPLDNRVVNVFPVLIEVKVSVNHAPLNPIEISNDGRKLELLLRRDTSTNFVLKEVFEKKVYEPLPDAPAPRGILDVGANQGITSGYLRLCFPQAEIIAVEPDPATFPILEENAKRIGRCAAHNLALLDRDGTASFKSSQISVVSTLYDLPHSQIQNDIVSVELRHAGEFADETASSIGVPGFDMLKIDTEGAEVPIMQALGHRLAGIATIFLEFHSLEDRRIIEAMLASSHDLRRELLDAPDRGSLTFLRRVV
jgi:FkbM family methyltransferase